MLNPFTPQYYNFHYELENLDKAVSTLNLSQDTHKGLSAAVFAFASEPSYPKATMAADIPESCSICLNSFTSADTIETPVQLYCGHVFGSTCFAAWMATSAHINCPQCRRSLRHDCGHICKTRPLTLHGLPQETNALKIPPSPENMVLEDECIACFVDAYTDDIEKAAVAAQRDIAREMCVEFLSWIGDSGWKGLSGNWEEVLEQLVKYHSLPSSAIQRQKDQQQAEVHASKLRCIKEYRSKLDLIKANHHHPRDHCKVFLPNVSRTKELLAQLRKEIARLHAEEVRLKVELEEEKEWRKKSEILVATVQAEEVDLENFEEMSRWIVRKVWVVEERRENFRELETEWADAFQIVKDGFTNSAMGDQW